MKEMMIAELKEIGERLENSRKQIGMSVEDVLNRLNISRSTWHRWTHGQIQAGCRDLAEAGLLFSKFPNYLLLTQPGDESFMTEEDKAALREIQDILIRMTELSDGGPERPTEIMRRMMYDALRTMEHIATTRQSRIPAGTVIEKGEAPVNKVYHAPGKRKGDAPAEAAGEDAAPYGKRKKK